MVGICLAHGIRNQWVYLMAERRLPRPCQRIHAFLDRMFAPSLVANDLKRLSAHRSHSKFRKESVPLLQPESSILRRECERSIGAYTCFPIAKTNVSCKPSMPAMYLRSAIRSFLPVSFAIVFSRNLIIYDCFKGQSSEKKSFPITPTSLQSYVCEV